MSLQFSVIDFPVTSSWQDAVRIKPKKIHSVLIYAEDAAIEIGTGGAGLPRAISEGWGLTWQDFDQKRLTEKDEMVIRLKCVATANAVITVITDV